MTMGGFCNALGLKDSIESLPVAQPRFFLVDEHCAANTRKKILDISGRGKVDLIVVIQTCKNDDQMIFEPQFDGQSELWCPQYLHDHLQLVLATGGLASACPMISHVWDETNNHFGMIFNVERFFSQGFQIWLDNKDTISEHVVEYLLVLYSKFPAV